MPESIQSFVARLKAEGVDAGQRDADQIRQQAREQADQLLADARQQAERIVAEARDQGRQSLDRTRTELRLAARDTVLTLRQTLGKALDAVVARAAQRTLDDPGFIRELLHELVLKYAQADIEGGGTMTIHVSEQMRQKLSDWAIGEIHDKTGGGLAIDLKDELHAAGFEYNVTGANIEVTVRSVAQLLSSMVAPAVRELLAEAVQSDGKEQ